MATHTKNRRLQELRGSGYEMDKGQPDIRGWEVVNENGQHIGKVHELVFDTVAMKVRYIVLNVADSNVLELEKRTVLVPIGFAHLHRNDKCLTLRGITPFQLRALPRYIKDGLGPKAERDISTVFGRSHTGIDSEDDVDTQFYNHDHFNDDMTRENRTTGTDNRITNTESRTAANEPLHSSDSERLAASQSREDDAEVLRRREQTLRDEEALRQRRNDTY